MIGGYLRYRRKARPIGQKNSQTGSIMLEALIGVLIFSLGILALIAMQARAMQLGVDATFRSNAAFLANQLFSQMWVSDKANAVLAANFQAGGVAYNAWLPQVQATLPGVAALPPQVVVDGNNNVTIVIRWQAPSERVAHTYTAVAQIVEQ